MMRSLLFSAAAVAALSISGSAFAATVNVNAAMNPATASFQQAGACGGYALNAWACGQLAAITTVSGSPNAAQENKVGVIPNPTQQTGAGLLTYLTNIVVTANTTYEFDFWMSVPAGAFAPGSSSASGDVLQIRFGHAGYNPSTGNPTTPINVVDGSFTSGNTQIKINSGTPTGSEIASILGLVSDQSAAGTWQQVHVEFIVGAGTFTNLYLAVQFFGSFDGIPGQPKSVQFDIAAAPPGQTDVPIPGSVLLFSSGLGALGLLAHRRRRKAKAA